jgi:hypothetical protein
MISDCIFLRRSDVALSEQSNWLRFLLLFFLPDGIVLNIDTQSNCLINIPTDSHLVRLNAYQIFYFQNYSYDILG